MSLPVQNHHQLINALADLEQKAATEANFFKLLTAIVTSITQTLAVDFAEVLERLVDNQAMLMLVGAGWDAAIAGQMTVAITPHSQLAVSLTSREPVIVTNWLTETRFPQPVWLRDRGIVSSINILIRDGAMPFGLLGVHTATPRCFTAADILFLQGAGNLISMALKQHQTAVCLKHLEAAERAKQHLEQEVDSLKRVEVVLRQSEERYALVANAAADGVWDWNLETKEIYFSPTWKTMLGYGENEIGNCADEWLNRLHPDDRDRFMQTVARHCEGLTACFESEYRLQHHDGTYHWMLSRGLSIRDMAGKAYRLVGSQTDITARKFGEEQLRHNALHDGLTGLANRTLFMERLQHALTLAQRHNDYKFAVVFLDLDRFKLINDSLGHLAGDQLLVTIAHRLKGCLRSSDTCARLGGDEFAILLEYVQDDQEAILIVERMQQVLKTPFHLNGQDVFANASIGIILSTMGHAQTDDLLRDADTAMYRAKALGRGRYEVFTQEMHEHAVTLLQLETDLRKAIERQEFCVYYQPVMELRTSRIIGFEALVRWQHPERGLVSPAEFIPIAEETGLILPIGNWVLVEACRQMRLWQQQYPFTPPLTISVNISRKQFSQPDLFQQIEQVLQDTGLQPHCLKLEITESAIMEDANVATGLMQQLKTLGVQLVMDDFGTGYSSLSHLHLFPIDTLKIDPSFVHKADTDLEKVEIIRTVISLAWNLGIDVVAEGIETKRQMSQLKLLKCDSAQGYLFSRPLTSEAAAAFLIESASTINTI